MPYTLYPEIDERLLQIREALQAILGNRLVALYLYGSLVTGDFEMRSSDIDLLAVTQTDLTESEFERLHAFHLEFMRQFPQWDNRLEIAYLAAEALKTFRTQTSRIAIISPGEPFHCKDAGNDWLINWWIVRQQGVALFGPPPMALIDPISAAEFLAASRTQARDWHEWVYHAPHYKGQAYAILTLCRALYAQRTGTQASKKQAAEWTQNQLPQYAPLINRALEWRVTDSLQIDEATAMVETAAFVHFVIRLIVGESA